MAVDAFLGGFVVIGDDGQGVVCAQSFGGLGEGDGFGSVVGAGTCNHGNAFADVFDGFFNHAQMLFNGQGGAFAGCSYGDDAVGAVVNVPVNQVAELFVMGCCRLDSSG